MKDKKCNNLSLNSNLMTDYHYELLIQNIMNATNLDERELLCNYFILNKNNTKHNYRPHISPIQKIMKRYTLADIKEKINKIYGDENIKITIEDKIDGIMINLIYYNGKLQSAITRGDKYGGEDLIDIVCAIVPNNIQQYDTLEIRGEITILTQDYYTYFSNYVSQRQAIIAIISKKKPNDTHVSKLKFYAYDLGYISKLNIPMSQINTYKYLNKLNINTVNHKSSDLDNLEQDFNDIKKNKIIWYY